MTPTSNDPAGTGMKIRINDTEYEVSADATVAVVPALIGIRDPRGVALAVNGTVVPRDTWAEDPLAEGDRVIVIRAAQGG